MFSNFESSFALLSVRLVLVPKQIVTIKPEKGRRACNYISKIWITCIKKVDAKCWLEEMTLALVMTSLPLAHDYMCFSMFVYSHTCFCFVLIGRNLTAQSTGSHRGTRQNSKSRDVTSPSFSCPVARAYRRACPQAIWIIESTLSKKQNIWFSIK